MLGTFTTFRGYRPDWLTGDILAGIMLAAIALPEQLATSRLAGFPPEAGLFAFAAGSVAFAIFGVNRFMSVGADSTISPIFAGSLAALVTAGSADYLELASFIALCAGLLLIVAGVLRAGWIADLLSIPVTTGILAGIAVHIVVGQLASFLGVPDAKGALLVKLFVLLSRLSQANPYTVTVGAGVLALTLIAARISPRIPGALIALVAAGIAVSIFDLPAHGVSVVGALHANVPAIHIPRVTELEQLPTLIPLAFIIALVCMMQTATVVRSFPSQKDKAEDVAPDFAAIGVGSVVSGLLGAFAVNSGPPRTAIVAQSGGRSQLAGIAAVAVLAAFLFSLSRLGAFLPNAALSGILMYVAIHIFRTKDMATVAKTSPREFSLLVLAIALVVALPIQQGMLLAIILSLSHGIRLVMRPPATELLHVPGSTLWWTPDGETQLERIPGVVVFAPNAAFNFTNAQFLHQKLNDVIDAAPQPVRLVVIEASSVFDFDYTGARMICARIAELRRRNITIAVARLIGPHAQEAAQRSGIVDALGADRIFKTVQEAVDTLGKG